MDIIMVNISICLVSIVMPLKAIEAGKETKTVHFSKFRSPWASRNRLLFSHVRVRAQP